MFLSGGQIECYPDCFCEGASPFGVLFWTSGAYFFSAVLLYVRNPRRNLEFEFWTFCTMTLAISSFFFHSTQTLAAVAVDYASISMTLLFFPIWEALKDVSRRRKELIFYLCFGSFWMVFYHLTKWYRIGLGFMIFLIALKLVRNEVRRLRYHQRLLASIIIGLVSFGAFLIEESGSFCAPASVIQFHGIWHVGSATALYLYGRWRFMDQIWEESPR